eukprot:7849941-Prorocentrum_lima.AAC.1
MTSSLVGSEMCIRDSGGGGSGSSSRSGSGRIGRSGSSRGSSHGSRCSSAVSYTHLTLPTICSV